MLSSLLFVLQGEPPEGSYPEMSPEKARSLENGFPSEIWGHCCNGAVYAEWCGALYQKLLQQDDDSFKGTLTKETINLFDLNIFLFMKDHET